MKMTLLRSAFAAALALGVSVPASAGELKLTMQDGRVTIIADNVPLRQILLEWARVGQTQIVNGDKVMGPALTLQLVNASERDALDILLRSASGYIAAPRQVPVANAAFYDRVTIMATSRAPAATASNSAPPPSFQRPPQPMIDDNDEPINVVMPPQMNGQINGQFPGMPPNPGMPPMMQPGQPPQQAPSSPLTLPRPGAVPQQLTAPGQLTTPGMTPNPYQPNPNQPIVRPPGMPPIPGQGRGGGPGGQ
jgi:hypothetical protein